MLSSWVYCNDRETISSQIEEMLMSSFQEATTTIALMFHATWLTNLLKLSENKEEAKEGK
jgi:hypothetical protein